MTDCSKGQKWEPVNGFWWDVHAETSRYGLSKILMPWVRIFDGMTYSLILVVLSTINCHGRGQPLVQLSSSGAWCWYWLSWQARIVGSAFEGIALLICFATRFGWRSPITDTWRGLLIYEHLRLSCCNCDYSMWGWQSVSESTTGI